MKNDLIQDIHQQIDEFLMQSARLKESIDALESKFQHKIDSVVKKKDIDLGSVSAENSKIEGDIDIALKKLKLAHDKQLSNFQKELNDKEKVLVDERIERLSELDSVLNTRNSFNDLIEKDGNLSFKLKKIASTQSNVFNDVIEKIDFKTMLKKIESSSMKLLGSRKLFVSNNVYFIVFFVCLALVLFSLPFLKNNNADAAAVLVIILFLIGVVITYSLIYAERKNLHICAREYLKYNHLLPETIEKEKEKIEKNFAQALSNLGNELTSHKESLINELDLSIQQYKYQQRPRFAALENDKQEIDRKYAYEMSQIKLEIEQIKNSLIEKSAEERAGFLRFQQKCFDAFPSWDSVKVDDLPPLDRSLSYLRLGEIVLRGDDGDYKLPALLPFPMQYPLVYILESNEQKAVIKNIHSALLRILLGFAPTKAKFIFVDPVGLGQNVGPFLNFLDYDEAIIHHQAYHDSHAIDKLFSELIERMALITQKFLRNQYADLEAYNQIAGDLAEANYFLVLFDFPSGISREMLPKLQKILLNGHICGIYSVLIKSDQLRNEDANNMLQQLRETYTIKKDSANNQLVFSLFDGLRFTIDLPPPNIDDFINKIGEGCMEARNITVPLSKLLVMNSLNDGKLWTAQPIDDLNIPIGVIGSTKSQYLSFGKGTAQHLLIAGKTGSGKSSLLHTIITVAALKYSPEELQLYLIDFKKGVEFKRYASSELPHARVIAIESEREFGISVLEGVDDEMQRRGVLFRKNGVENFKEYRQKTKEKLPRILLVIDEYQEFFSVDSDIITLKVSQILDRLVRQGRAFGIHLILGSQTIAGSYNLSRSTIDQIAIRIALQCSEDDSRLILSNDNPAARMLSRPGEAIFNAMNGRTEGNFLFQVAWPGDDEQQNYLEQLRKLEKSNGFVKIKPIVFEGNDVSRIEQNESIERVLSGRDTWKLTAYIGEPISIKETTSIEFKPQSGSNLLVLGQDTDLANGLVFSLFLNLAANYRHGKAKIITLDLTPADSPMEELMRMAEKQFRLEFSYARRGSFAETLGSVYAHLQAAKNGKKEKQTVFLILNGMQRMKELEADAYGSMPTLSTFGSFGGEKTEKKADSNALLKSILEEGPDYQIFTIVWCDSYKNLTRRLSRQLLREFDLKVLCRMNPDDSINLIDTIEASKLKPNQALYYNEDSGQTEKFKPFGLPEKNWLLSKL